MISQAKTLKIKSFLPFNFAITKIRMEQEWAAFSFDYLLVLLCIKFLSHAFFTSSHALAHELHHHRNLIREKSLRYCQAEEEKNDLVDC